MTPVDVLIVNYRTPDLALAAVRAVQGPDTRILVFDNSADLQDLPGVELYGDGRNHLFAAANNALFERTTSELILLLNPDVVLQHEQLRALVTRLEADSSLWGVAPAFVTPEGGSQNYLRRLPTLPALLADRFPPLRMLLRRAFDAYYCRDVDLAVEAVHEQPAAACLLLRRRDLGGRLFDPDFQLFFNDTDLARRLNERGGCLYVPSVRVVHHGGGSLGRARTRYRSWVRRTYDDALLLYARRFLRGWWLLLPVIIGRRVIALRPVPPPGTVL